MEARPPASSRQFLENHQTLFKNCPCFFLQPTKTQLLSSRMGLVFMSKRNTLRDQTRTPYTDDFSRRISLSSDKKYDRQKEKSRGKAAVAVPPALWFAMIASRWAHPAQGFFPSHAWRFFFWASVAAGSISILCKDFGSVPRVTSSVVRWSRLAISTLTLSPGL